MKRKQCRTGPLVSGCDVSDDVANYGLWYSCGTPVITVDDLFTAAGECHVGLSFTSQSVEGDRNVSNFCWCKQCQSLRIMNPHQGEIVFVQKPFVFRRRSWDALNLICIFRSIDAVVIVFIEVIGGDVPARFC